MVKVQMIPLKSASFLSGCLYFFIEAARNFATFLFSCPLSAKFVNSGSDNSGNGKYSFALVKFLLSLVVLFVVVSCSKEKAPEGLIDSQTMKEVLLNMHLADASLDYVSPQDSVPIKAKSKYNFIFQKYGIDSAAFSSSLRYYTEKDPEELLKIYNFVLVDLEDIKQSQEHLYSRAKRLLPMSYQVKDYKFESDTIDYPLKKSIVRTDSLRQQREIQIGIDF